MRQDSPPTKKKSKKKMDCYKFKKGFNVKLFVVVTSALFLISYGVFNARNMLMGPIVEIFSPAKDMETSSGVITVKGRAKNITFISLNEKPISVDTEGLFENKLLLSPGSNIIEVKAKDRFKNEVVKTVRVYYTQNAPQTEISKR